jgi:hypothetical protein
MCRVVSWGLLRCTIVYRPVDSTSILFSNVVEFCTCILRVHYMGFCKQAWIADPFTYLDICLGLVLGQVVILDLSHISLP